MNVWEVLLLVALVIGGIYYYRKREQFAMGQALRSLLGNWPAAESHIPIMPVVSMGRRNTKLEVYLQESPRAKIARER